jgi:hypothetical protein
MPVADAQQDVVLTRAWQDEGGRVLWMFSREADTRDADGDDAIVPGPTRLVFAWSTATSDVRYHGVAARGTALVDFYGSGCAAGPPTVVLQPQADAAPPADTSFASVIGAGVLGAVVGVAGVGLTLLLLLARRRAVPRAPAGSVGQGSSWEQPAGGDSPGGGATPSAAAQGASAATWALEGVRMPAHDGTAGGVAVSVLSPLRAHAAPGRRRGSTVPAAPPSSPVIPVIPAR